MKINSEILDRIPPHDLDAERWVIGSALLQPACLDELTEIVRPHDFHSTAHEILFRRLVAMRDASEPIDIGLLVASLRESSQLKVVGDVAYIAELMQGIPHAGHAKHYAAIVALKARYRRLIHAATATLKDAYDATDSPNEILNNLERDLAEVEVATHTGEPVLLSDAVADAIARIDAVTNRTQRAGLMTGLPKFDTSIGGLFRGELFVLAARPGVGKTSLACQVSAYVGERKHRTLFVSLEMSATELATRMMCSRSGVSSRKLRVGTLTKVDAAALAEHAGPLAASPVFVYDRAGASVADIRRYARRMHRHGLDLIVVDYLQRITPRDRRANRYEQVGDIAGGLKELARELDVPLLCLCQLSREADKGGTPVLSWLRESGDIEFHCDVVAFLFVKASENARNPEQEALRDKDATLAILKNRNGETGDIRLKWIPYRTMFECDETPAAETYSEFDGYA